MFCSLFIYLLNSCIIRNVQSLQNKHLGWIQVIVALFTPSAFILWCLKIIPLSDFLHLSVFFLHNGQCVMIVNALGLFLSCPFKSRLGFISITGPAPLTRSRLGGPGMERLSWAYPSPLILNPPQCRREPSAALRQAVWFAEGAGLLFPGSSGCVFSTVVQTPAWRIAPRAPGWPAAPCFVSLITK